MLATQSEEDVVLIVHPFLAPCRLSWALARQMLQPRPVRLGVALVPEIADDGFDSALLLGGFEEMLSFSVVCFGPHHVWLDDEPASVRRVH